MRLSGLIALNLLVLACATTGQPRAELDSGKPSARSFFEQVGAPCEAFEILDFGTKTAAALRGRVRVADGDDELPKRGVTVVAREAETGRLYHDVTDEKGRYKVPELLPGRHQVWSCLEGFDVVAFSLIVDRAAQADEVDIVLRPSESAGVSRVVVLPAP